MMLDWILILVSIKRHFVDNRALGIQTRNEIISRNYSPLISVIMIV